MDARRSLIGLSTPQLVEVATSMGESRFRGKQLATHLYKHNVTSIADMRDLPAAFRNKLAEEFVVTPLHVASHLKASDGVEKLLVHNGDNQVFECVLLPYEDRVSCCISTQVGCPMGCVFCATGLGGFDRNLTVGEIVGQYLMLQGLTERRISHIVFMGMGEPMLNLDAVIQSLQIFHEDIGLSYRHLTISTVGLVPQIQRLAELKLPIHLALSLHSSLDEVRSKLMPVNQKWGVEEVIRTMAKYQRSTGRKVTFEYLLIEGVNDTKREAQELARLIKDIPNVVNIIPWNWVDTGHGFTRPSRSNVRSFKAELERHGVNVTERMERGHDIAAACGQLAGQHQGRFAKRKESTSELKVIS